MCLSRRWAKNKEDFNDIKMEKKASLAIILTLVLLNYDFIPAASQTGFISLSCGAQSGFTDKSTGISWEPDSKYISSGLTSTTQQKQSTTVRYFPLSTSTRNLECFDIKLGAGLYLTRATFSYGNYDKKGMAPSFQFVLNQTVVSNIDLSSQDPWVEELVWSSASAVTAAFCLLASSKGGVPVISSLEVRPLAQGAYQAAGLGSGKTILRKQYRINCGETSQTIRYPNDPQDRIWDTDRNFFPQGSSTALSYNGSISATPNTDAAPLSVLQTSRVASGSTLSYVLDLPGPEKIFVVAYFAKLVNSTVQTSFNILLNNALQQQNFQLPGSFIATSYGFTGNASSSLNLTMQGQFSTPEINALEVYKFINVVPPTTSTDVSALFSILSPGTSQLEWDHDPCLPIPWTELQCTPGEDPEITSLDLSGKGLNGPLLPSFGDLSELRNLNLSSNGLSGHIPDGIWGLNSLESLDLSYNGLTGTLPTFNQLESLKILNLQNNSLSGEIPDSLGNLPNLQSVNIINNNFSGLIPASLKGKVQSSGNLCIGSTSADCFQKAPPPAPSPNSISPVSLKSKSQTGKVVGIAVGSIAGVFLVIGTALFCLRKKWKGGIGGTALPTDIRKNANSWANCKQFSYKELSNATNRFKDELGRGSFGPVYHGKLANGQEVAIKLRSDASQLGAEAFINEVNLLSGVHHQNLVALVGFCQNSKKQLLVYEFMPGGTLMDHLYGSRSRQLPLDWMTRLHIAVGAATALDYLHNGSDPKIIHRDVKSSNILLDSSMTAKVADFGLSKHLARIDATHVTTLVKGTAGYLDPEYYASNQLTEKSDVYSFGVVLLEIICGREPLSDDCPADQYSLIAWARPYLLKHRYEAVVDRKILGNFNLLSMEIVATVASKSVERDPADRPTMSEVVRELKEALAIEKR